MRLRLEETSDPAIEELIAAMESTLKGMVEYSVAGVSESRLSEVDMEAILNQVLPGFPAGTISHDPLPVVMGDTAQLVTVMRHLLDNATKFHGQDAPHLHVTANRTEGRGWCPCATTDRGSILLIGSASSCRSNAFMDTTTLATG